MKKSNILLLSALGLTMLVILAGAIFLRVNVLRPAVTGDNNIISQTRSLNTFSSINVTGPFVVSFTQGPGQEVKVEADQNLMDKVITKVEGQELKVFPSEHIYSNKLRLTIQLPRIVKLNLSSGAKFRTLSPINQDSLYVLTEAGSDAEIQGSFAFIDLIANSGSDIDASGTARELKIIADAGCKVNADELFSKSCDVTSLSGSKVYVWVENGLKAKAMAGGRVYYKGQPANIVQDISSGGMLSTFGNNE